MKKTGGSADAGNPMAADAAPTTASPAAPVPFSWEAALGGEHDHYRDLLVAKGWAGPADALKSYRQLEQTLGTERIAVPKPGDREAMRHALAKLGAPDKPEAYDLPKPRGMAAYDEATAEMFRGLAHEASLTKAQARALHDGWVRHVSEAADSRAAAADRADRALEETLRADWGSGYDAQIDLARRAARRFADEPTATAIEQTLGPAGLVKLFGAIGGHLGEDRLEGRGGGSVGQAGALAEIGSLKLDGDFMAALGDRNHLGHAEAQARWRRLHDTAFPGLVTG